MTVSSTSPTAAGAADAPPAGPPRVVVVMPAYNAARTLEKTYGDLDKDKVYEVILVDDVSSDDTVEIAQRLA